MRKSTSTRARLGLGVLLAVVLGLHTACNRCESTPKPTEGQAPPVAALAPAPRELLFDLFVPKPAGVWSSFRELAGSAARLLPVNVGLMAARLLGLEPVLASRIDADLPWLGAVLRSKEGRPGWVFAMHLQSGAEFVAELTKGNKPSHRAKQSQGVTLLERMESNEGPRLGVVDNYLVAGSDVGALGVAAGYAARTLPRREMPDRPVVLRAGRDQLRGAAVDWLEATWASYRKDLDEKRKNAQLAHGGRAPDFGEPTAVVSALDAWVTDLAAYARSSETLEMALEVSKASASLELELSPVKGGKAASWIDDIPVGRARNVLSLPAGCSLAIWTNSSPGDRAGDASALNAGLESLLGPRLSEPEHKAMLGIFENLAKGRGDELLVGFVVAPQAGLLVQGTVSDQAAIAAALEKLPSLFRMSVVAEPLASFVGRPNVVPSQPSLAGTRSVRLEFASAGRAKGDGQSFEAIWSADEKHYRWVAGPAPARALFQLLREPTSTLQSSARLAARLGAIEHASSVILLNPSNLGLLDATSGETEMALVVAGRRNGHASIEVEVPSDVVRAGLSSGFQP